MLRKRRSPCSSETVGTSAIIARQSFDETKPLKPSERFIQSAGLQFHCRKLGHVFDQRVPVFFPTGEARENKCGYSGILSETIRLIGGDCHKNQTTQINDLKQNDVRLPGQPANGGLEADQGCGLCI
jgi:hypothetical protein